MVASIGTAIRETLAGELPHAEKEAIARIEQRRTALLESDGRITVVDFGAGRPDSRRSREEMERGVQSTAQVSRITAVSKPPFWALLLYKLVRRLEPVSCLELGTCVGISAAYQATALRFNGAGTMTSLEGAPEIAAIAGETFATRPDEAIATILLRTVTLALFEAAGFAVGWYLLLSSIGGIRYGSLPQMLSWVGGGIGILFILARFLSDEVALIVPLATIGWSLWLGRVLGKKEQQ